MDEKDLSFMIRFQSNVNPHPVVCEKNWDNIKVRPYFVAFNMEEIGFFMILPTIHYGRPFNL